ncbi:uncharacterized protein LOC133316919 [Gastrolobium bilobum]|uniref:uncharacterized protein LOC133316919 n=1 Tax=Gastrolobium bilobum TaxID=150636 RepID=UPI002AAF823E|nr:uncharacterized protein LOC133316919 [Gastrolobium bilobum]
MKLSTSSYASPSPSSTVSFDPTMCNSKSTTSGCLTAILRKILCSCGLPTDPSDQKRELDSSNSIVSGKDQNLKAKQNAEAAITTTTTTAPPPGIVARLMGLESMGEIPYASTPNSLSRSRSMNSLDHLGECNGLQGPHKRVNSTLSFREAPNNFLLLKNENFLVLSFETEGESREFKSNGRKREMGSAELKQKVPKERGVLKENKREKVYDEKILIQKRKLSKRVSDMSCGNVGNDGKKLQEITNISYPFKATSKKKCSDSEAVKLLQPKNSKEAVIGEKLKRRKKKTSCYSEKKTETECKSEDSSPVSVLEFEREACGTVGLSSRRKLSPELENDQHFNLRSDSNLMIEENKVKETESNKCEGSKKKEKHSQEYIHNWGEVSKLVKDELVGSNKIHAWMNKQGDLGSISADFESEIFDQLLNELIDQLVGHPLTTL